MSTATLEQSDLDRAARAINTAVDTLLYAMHLQEEGSTAQALEQQEKANQEAQRALRLLLTNGARVDATLPTRREIPLHQLDTPATRALLDALAWANEAALRVDQERGDVLPSGEGIGWADTVGDVYHRLRVEVEGPRSARGD